MGHAGQGVSVRLHRLFVAAVAVVLGLGCVGDPPSSGNTVPPPPPPPPPPPTATPFLELVSGGGQQDTVAQTLGQLITVQAIGPDSAPLPLATVRFVLPTRRPASPTSPPDADTVEVTADSSGLASASWTLPEITGTFNAVVLLAGAPVLRVPGTAVPDAPASLDRFGVVPEFGAPVGTALLDSVQVRLTDRFGNPRPGFLVTAAIQRGTGSLPASAAQTGITGLASFGYVVSATPGQDTLRITGPPVDDTVLVEATAFLPPGPDSLALGRDHSCELTTVVRCWGSDVAVLQFPTFAGLPPAVIPVPAPLVTLAAANGFSCGLDAGGALICWGGAGQWAPVGSTSPRVLHAGHTYRSVTGGGQSEGCGVRADWIVECFGSGLWSPSFGLPQTLDPTAPRFRQYNSGGRDVSGGNSACGVSVGGRVWCRSSFLDLLGRGPSPTWTPRWQPVASTERFEEVTVGTIHACARTADGRVFCWGYAPAVVPSSVPVELPTVLRFTRLRAGGETTCGLATDARLYCWGPDTYLSNGTGPTPVPTTGPTVAAAGGIAFRAMDVGDGHVCGLPQAGGPVLCWGRNWSGQAGTSGLSTLVPDTLPGGLRFTSIGLGTGMGCGLAAGTAWCWGAGTDGRLGTGDTLPRLPPAPAAGGQALVRLSVGQGGVCGITPGGTAVCWGLVDPVPATLAPDPVPGATFDTVVVGASWACGIGQDHVTRCWGAQSSQPLGNGSPFPSATPVVVAGSHVFTGLSAGSYSTCGLEADGAAWCWGYGDSGTPTGGVFNSSIPTPVASALRFRALELPASCGITLQDEYWCWANAAAPARLDLGFTVAEQTQAALSSCARGLDGVVRCWGDNANGQLGDGTTVSRSTLAPVLGVPLLVQLTGNFMGTSCALAADGQAWCWGYNGSGETGRIVSIAYPPVAVP